MLEIYNLVSSKALDPAESGPRPGDGQRITMTAAPAEKQGGKCC